MALGPIDFLRINYDMHQEVKNSSVQALGYGVFIVAIGVFVISASLITAQQQVQLPGWLDACLIISWICVLISLACAGAFFFLYYQSSLKNQYLLIEESNSRPQNEWRMNYPENATLKKLGRYTNAAVIGAIVFLIVGAVALLIYASGYFLALQNMQNFHNGLPEYVPVLQNTPGLHRTIIMENYGGSIGEVIPALPPSLIPPPRFKKLISP